MFAWIVRHPLPVLAAALAVTVGFASKLPSLTLDPDVEAYIPKRHPVRAYWVDAKDRFGLGLAVFVAIDTRRPDGVFEPRTLAGLAELTERIESLDDVELTRVRSLANSEAIVGTEDSLDVIPFYEEPPRTAAEAAEVRSLVMRNDMFRDRLVSRDGSIAAIAVDLWPEDVDPDHAYKRILGVAQEIDFGDSAVLIAGSPAVEAVFGRQMADDLRNLIPLSLLVVAFILYACFPIQPLSRVIRNAAFATTAIVSAAVLVEASVSFWVIPVGLALAMLPTRGVLLPSLVVVVSVIWTWGTQAILGIPIYISGVVLPPLLLAIGCADGIHIIERYMDHAVLSDDRSLVITRTMEELWRPMVLTSVTTAIGFASLMTGELTALRTLGGLAAFGILAAMVLSLLVLPALLIFLPLPEEPSEQPGSVATSRGLMRLGEWLEAHRVAVVVGGMLLAVAAIVSALRLRVDYSWVESLQEGTLVLDSDRILRKRHGGTLPLNVIVSAPADDGIKDPALLAAMDRVLAEIGTHPDVGDTRSIAEYIKRMNEAMNEGRVEAYEIPGSRDLVAQYLLLYSMSGDPAELDDLVDYEYRHANMTVQLRRDEMSVLRDVISRMERLLDEHVRPLGVDADLTGSAVMQDTVMRMSLAAQVSSLTSAALLVFVTMWVLFRSALDAALCMIPVAFGATLNFGAMGVFDIPLGPQEAMLTAIALGIGIDYSIHLMVRFRDAAATGFGIDDAIVESMRTSGRAVLYNALVVVAGFLVLAFSRSPSNATFGSMIAGNMTACAFAALTLMPAALTAVGHSRFASSMLPRGVTISETGTPSTRASIAANPGTEPGDAA